MQETMLDVMKAAKYPLTARKIADKMAMDVKDVRDHLGEYLQTLEVETVWYRDSICYKPKNWNYGTGEAERAVEKKPQPAPKPKEPKAPKWTDRITEALQAASEPLSLRQIAIATGNIDNVTSVSACLTQMKTKGTVRRVGENGNFRWYLTGQFTPAQLAASDEASKEHVKALYPSTNDAVDASPIVAVVEKDTAIKQQSNNIDTRIDDLHQKNINLAQQLDSALSSNHELKAEIKALVAAIKMSSIDRQMMAKAIRMVNAANKKEF